ncbi:MAG: MBL fold metallo-hydrolase [Myxococcaceae bacterium]|nr:MBL fold metallo-hydrolase [Myxococcaceae bacterium]MCA3011435.1 MBL fold metallo-hydrolase [Myxococcaceae bacterium]
MRVVRLDDYQSWRVDVGGRRVLVDPWLTTELTYAFGLATRRRAFSPAEAEREADLLVLTAHFGDHLHPPSLALLPKVLPAWSTAAGCRRLGAVGFTRAQVASPGQVVALGSGASLTFVSPGFPFSTSALGLVFEEAGKRAYLEAHVTTAQRLGQVGRVDLLVTTAEGVRLFGVQLSMDARRAARMAAAAGARVVAPTGLHPHAAKGLLPSLLSVRSEPDALQRELERCGSRAQARWLRPGEAVEL